MKRRDRGEPNVEKERVDRARRKGLGESSIKKSKSIQESGMLKERERVGGGKRNEERGGELNIKEN